MTNRFLIDLGPLRQSRDFRLLFVGQMANMLGSQLAVVAIPFQVYELTRSSLQVGAVSLAQLIPLVVGALAGGTLADAWGRRPVMVVTALVLALASGTLAVNAWVAHPSVIVIYIAAAIGAGVGGAYSTACTSVAPSLVPPERLLAAFATMQVVDQVGMVAGPALSGLLLQVVHLTWVFALDSVSSVVLVACVACMAALPATPGRERRLGLSIRAGLRAIRGDHVLLGAYLIDLNAMVFGAPSSLFPALNHAVFGGSPGTLGLLYAAPGAGALLGALTTGWLDRIRRQGVAIMVAVAVWGAAIAAFGLVRTFWAALVLLALAGWADVLSAVLRTTVLQTHAGEALRSRVASVQMAVVEGGPRLGGFESGALASATSTEFSVVAGGLVAIAGALVVGAALPDFRRYRPARTADGPEPGPR
jgi:predicted MFS family arabinose efflux permease